MLHECICVTEICDKKDYISFCYSEFHATQRSSDPIYRGGLALLFWGGVMVLEGPVERGQALNGCSHLKIV